MSIRRITIDTGPTGVEVTFFRPRTGGGRVYKPGSKSLRRLEDLINDTDSNIHFDELLMGPLGITVEYYTYTQWRKPKGE